MQEIDKLLDAISKDGISLHELLIMQEDGCTLEEAKKIHKEMLRINKLADEIRDAPIDAWPTFQINWDIDPKNFHLAFDGLKQHQLDTQDYEVVWVKLAELDTTFNRYSQRSIEETWIVGFGHKVARVIVHCLEGGKLTPPHIIPIETELSIAGGHHRLAVCRAKKIEDVPLLIKKEDLTKVSKILKLMKTSNL